MVETELQKHIRNIRFNANKWEYYLKRIEDIQKEIAGLQAGLIVLKAEASKYSKKTRQLARLEVI